MKQKTMMNGKTNRQKWIWSSEREVITMEFEYGMRINNIG